jgi:hypothetical protein
MSTSSESVSLPPWELKVPKDDPLCKEHELMEAFLKESHNEYCDYSRLKLEDSAAGRTIAKLPPAEQCRVFEVMLDRQMRLYRYLHQPEYKREEWPILCDQRNMLMVPLHVMLVRRKLPLEERLLKTMTDWLAAMSFADPNWFPLPGAVKAIENFAAKAPLNEPLQAALAKLATLLHKNKASIKFSRRLAGRLEELVGSKRK